MATRNSKLETGNSLYTPRHFEGDCATALRLVEAHPFATLVTPSPLHVTHLPLLLERGVDGDVLRGHVAKPNGHWQALRDAPSVAIFHGPHAYISPRWYENPPENVPTWNYAAVHAHGRAVLLESADDAEDFLDALAARFENVAEPWAADWSRPRLQGLLRGIVAFRMRIERLEVKLKLSQNKGAGDRAGVLAALERGGGEERAVAQWMRETGSGGAGGGNAGDGT